MLAHESSTSETYERVLLERRLAVINKELDHRVYLSEDYPEAWSTEALAHKLTIMHRKRMKEHEAGSASDS